MKKIFLFFLLVLLFKGFVFAQKISEQQALLKAQKFMVEKKFSIQKTSLARSRIKKQEKPKEPFYIFNVEDNNGFVIVSGDERTDEIIGYSDKGRIDVDNMPINMQEWLEGYAEQIKALDNNTEVRKTHRSEKLAIAPLIKTQWGQGEPYNRMCPTIGGENCVAGCVATAMAQILYYYKDYIKEVPVIPGYVTPIEKINMLDLPSTEFDWNNMLLSYPDLYYTRYTEESKNAVAKLMLYCGQSVNMDYGIRESAGGSIKDGIINYFGISKNCRYIYRTQFGPEWEDIIYKEISEGRPVCYAGKNIYSGHAFICDGYDGEGNFHINWGWAGGYDGFFKLSLYQNFSALQNALIGIIPSSDNEELLPTVKFRLDWIKQTYSRKSLSDDFVDINISGNISTNIDNPNIEYAWALYNNNERIKVFETIKGTGKANEEQYLRSSINYGSNVSSGKFHLKMTYRLSKDSDWTLVENASYCYVLEIDGNTLNVRIVRDGYEVTGIEYIGKLLKNHSVRLKISVTNNGDTYHQLFFIRDGYKIIDEKEIYISPGQSEDIYVNYKPEHLGKTKIQMSTNMDFKGDLNYEDEIEICEAPEQNLQLDISIRGARNNTISGTDLDVDVKIKNIGSYTFDDDIVFTHYIGLYEEIRPIRIEPGDSTIQTFHVSNLTKGKTYSIFVTYYKNADFSNFGSSIDCLVGFNLFESHLEAKINVKNPLYDAKNNYIYDTYPELELEVKNNDDYEYIDNVCLSWFLWKLDNSPSKGVVGEAHDIYLKGGESVKIPIDFRYYDTQWDVYSINASYYSERIEKEFFPSGIGYTMKRELPVSKVFMDELDIKAGEKKDVNIVLDVKGLKCTDLEFDMLLPNGISLDVNNDKSIYYSQESMVKGTKVEHKEGNLYHFIMTMNDNWGRQDTLKSIVKVRVHVVNDMSYGIYTAMFSNLVCRYKDKFFPVEDGIGKVVVANPVPGKEFKLTYLVDGDIYVHYLYEEGIVIKPEPEPKKEGYTFSGWSEIPVTMPDHDVTVSGYFSKNKSLNDYVLESSIAIIQDGHFYEITPPIKDIKKIYIDLRESTSNESYCFLKVYNERMTKVLEISSKGLSTNSLHNITISNEYTNIAKLAENATYSWLYFNPDNKNEVILDVEKLFGGLGTIMGWQVNFGTSCIVNILTRNTDSLSSVKSINTEDSPQNKIYNLQGQQVQSCEKGIYIINGKKIVQN